MRLRLRGSLVRVLSLAALLFAATASQASASSFTVLFFEQGPDAFGVGFGSIDLDEQLKLVGLDPPAPDSGWVSPAARGMFLGSPGPVDSYLFTFVDQPLPFGPGGYTEAGFSNGDFVGIQPAGILPACYGSQPVTHPEPSW